MNPLPNLSWWQRLLDAIGVGLSKPVDALPPDAERELARWTPEDIAEYRRTHGGEAPPDAPHIEDGGI